MRNLQTAPTTQPTSHGWLWLCPKCFATRIRTYGLPVSDAAQEYVEAIYALPAFQEWLGEALKEPWIVEHDEIDFIQGKSGAAGA